MLCQVGSAVFGGTGANDGANPFAMHACRLSSTHPETAILWERHAAAIGAESPSHKMSSRFSDGHYL